jgi:metal-responsive CopG/Arc/MetJ family transcriptional regulator
MQKIMISMPDDLAEKIRWAFPAQQRSKIIAGILSAEIARREQELHEVACQVESEDTLNNEMAEWEEATIEDGIQPESW